MLRLRPALSLLGVFSMSACVAAPEFVTAPTISPNPNTQAPLVALIDFEAADASATRVAIDDGERQWDIDFPRTASADEPLIILGMRPGRHHTMTVSILDDRGNAVSAEPLTFDTPPLPVDRYLIPQYQVNVSEPEQMEPGVTFLSVRRSMLIRPQDRTPAQTRFAVNYGLILVFDAEGEVVWYYQSTDDRIAGIDRLRNGNIIYHLASFETVEMDLLGNKVRRWYAEERPRGPSDDPNAIPITRHADAASPAA